MKRVLAFVVVLACAAPAAAQEEPAFLSIRPFVMGSQQQFAAVETFEAIFGTATQPFWGGGVQVTQEDRFYVELGASKFRKTGERAFRNTGQTFRVGIPLTVTITPFEITGGYRFHLGQRVVPYIGGGPGWYRYKETSNFSTDAENVNVRKTGLVVEGGVEFRLFRWVGAAADVHFAHIPGILGEGGISKDAGEKDLGGVAARVKVIVGR